MRKAIDSTTSHPVVPGRWLLAGDLHDADRGDPIAGLPLTLAVDDGTASVVVATGASGPDGAFVLTEAPDLPPGVAALLRCPDDTVARLSTTLPDGTTQDLTEVALDALGTAVHATLTLPPARVDWAELGATLADRGVDRVSDLVRAIGDPAVLPDPAARRQALAELEKAFLDPTGALSARAPLPSWSTLAGGGLPDYLTALGDHADLADAVSTLGDRLASFDSLTQVDWPLDVTGLHDRPIDGLVGDLADRFRRNPDLVTPWPGRGNPLIGYRDYLVGVWLAVAGQNWYWAYQTAPTPAQARAQLESRFHQDFTTRDTASAPAPELLIGIVTRILTDPAPTGLALPAGTVPARGATGAREYLDALIALSGESARELGLRYRLDLTRDEATQSSPVAENIATLQGFFRDGFQSEPDPFHTPPDVRKDAIIPSWQQGTAPFFLQYEEWLAQTAPFYPENLFSMTRSLRLDDLISNATSVPTTDPLHAWAKDVAAMLTTVGQALTALSAGEYAIALARLDAARGTAIDLVLAYEKSNGFGITAPLAARRAFAITDKPSLLRFERLLGFPALDGNPNPYQGPGDWTGDRLAQGAALFAGYFSWVWRSDALLATGRFTEAALCLEGLLKVAVGSAELDSPAGYFDYWHDSDAYLYAAGPAPYTYDRSEAPQYVDPSTRDEMYQPHPGDDMLPPRIIAPLLHRMDVRFLRLRLGAVLLEWADTLFRADDVSSTARARELYKAVLWLHGEDPGISPSWPTGVHGPLGFLPGLGGLVAVQPNPAVVSQVSRARLGFTEIEAGLNYFGTTVDFVPVQRYRTLKDAADRFAALAVAAERDFLAAMAHLEDISVETMRTSNLLAKARSQRSIAQEQVKIATYQVSVAQQQVADVEAQIAAKKAEIADHDSFLGQFSDFAEGLVSTFKGAPGDLTKSIGEGAAAEAGLGDASTSGLLGLGAGASVLAGFGLFWYAGNASMSSMATQYAARDAQLKRLQDVTLRLATGNVEARKREVTIAQLQAANAEADIDLARDLMAFTTQRMLNAEFWASVAQVLRRVLRRYLDLGAWSGWLAERALAFEQDRSLRIVRMDYLARPLQGVTGGQLLQGDLAELEAARIAGERALVPFTCAISLVEDFPLAFGALKASGRATFSTSETALRRFFPGTFGHRVRTVDVDLRVLPSGRRVRGTLVNHGVSLATTDESLTPRPLMRFPDAIAVSETAAPSADPRLAEVLAPFEGIGMDTTWTLDLDEDASAGWWDSITDVVLRVTGLARYAESVRTSPPPADPVHRLALVSAARFAPDDVRAVRTTGTGTVRLDLDAVPLAHGETKRTVSNLVVLLPGAAGAPVRARLALATPALDLPFTITDGAAMSNGAPLRLPGSALPDAALNPAIGAPVDQVWTLTVEASPGADLSALVDVVLGVDYQADPA